MTANGERPASLLQLLIDHLTRFPPTAIVDLVEPIRAWVDTASVGLAEAWIPDLTERIRGNWEWQARALAGHLKESSDILAKALGYADSYSVPALQVGDLISVQLSKMVATRIEALAAEVERLNRLPRGVQIGDGNVQSINFGPQP